MSVVDTVLSLSTDQIASMLSRIRRFSLVIHCNAEDSTAGSVCCDDARLLFLIKRNYCWFDVEHWADKPVMDVR